MSPLQLLVLCLFVGFLYEFYTLNYNYGVGFGNTITLFSIGPGITRLTQLIKI